LEQFGDDLAFVFAIGLRHIHLRLELADGLYPWPKSGHHFRGNFCWKSAGISELDGKIKTKQDNPLYLCRVGAYRRIVSNIQVRRSTQ
jgi:hypothetical protein